MGHFTFPVFYCLVLFAGTNAVSSTLEPESTEIPKQFNATESHNVHQSQWHGHASFNMTQQEIQQGKDVIHPMRFIESLCPGSYSCARDSLQTSYQKKINGGCCVLCGCSDDCYVSGNCCPDKENANTDTASRTVTLAGERCFSTATPNTPVKSKEWFPDIHLQYLMRGDCSNCVNCTLKTKCETPNKYVIEEVAPVYSAKTGFYYRNKFCAECNDDNESTAWRPYLKCADYTHSRRAVIKNPTGESLRNFYNTMPPECYLVWKPPLENYKICFSMVPEGRISIGISGGAHSFLQDYCDYYGILYKTGRKIYRNVFCFLAEKLHLYLNDTFIFSDIGCPLPESCPNSCGYVTFDPFYPFSAMIDYFNEQESTPSQTAAAEKACKGKFYYSSTLDECLRQDCSFSSTYINGTCRSIIGELNKATYDFRLAISFHITARHGISFELVKGIALQLVLETRTGIICYTNVVHILYSDARITYYVAVVVNVEGPSVAEKVYKDFKDTLFAHQGYSSSKYMYQVSLGGNVNFPDLFTDHIRYIFYEDLHEIIGCPTSIAVADLQFCETVIINQKHFTLFHQSGTSMLLINGTTFHPDEYIIRAMFFEGNASVHKTHAHICMSTYISRMGEVSTASFEADIFARDLSNNHWSSYDRTLFLIASGVSIACLLLIILIYIRSRPQSLKERTALVMVINLFLSQIFLSAGMLVSYSEIWCKVVAFFTHYFSLVYFSSTSVNAYHCLQMQRTQHTSTHFPKRTIIRYCSVCYFPSLVLTLANVYVSSNWHGTVVHVPPYMCSRSTYVGVIVTFCSPIFLTFAVNCLMVVIACSCSNRHSDASGAQNEVGVFAFVGCLTLMMWTAVLLHYWIGIEWLKYCFYVFTSAHGLCLMFLPPWRGRKLSFLKKKCLA